MWSRKEKMKMLPINKILCPTDFSEPSYEGLKCASELAEHFSAEIILVNVVSSAHLYPSPAGGVPANLSTYLEEMVRYSKKSLEVVVQNKISPNLKVRAVVLEGNPADQVVELAKSEKVSVIVTATHGLTGWRHFIFGSVAERIVRLASCPVLTVPAPQEEEKDE
jgi:nucleotide-binding universal stress UspA family protein